MLACGHAFPGFDGPPGCVYCGMWLRSAAFRRQQAGSPSPPPPKPRPVCPLLGERVGGTPCSTPLHRCLADDTVCATAAPCLDAVRWCGACPLRPTSG